uniref:G-protein coupled receptors family 3 profile domain-containing protein n=1 Tax=Acanthochromis polyacanthus TaxID=80966 RepID=A0A3Q1FBJ4_9TELE
MVAATMKRVLLSLCLLGSVLHALAQCIVPASEFRLEGDYSIGGIFNIHQVINDTPSRIRPEAIDCSSQPFILSNYRRFQLMRFAVEQINNSTKLLPNISLGYEVFDHCSDTQSFPGILNFISVNDEVQPWGEPHMKQIKVIGAIGAFQSTQTRTVAPLFMMDLIPLVSYGASSSIFSRKQNFPSFLRTVRPNQDVIDVVVHIVKHFNWRWVAFLYIDDEYGKDVVDLFIKKIKDTEICLPYSKHLDNNTDYSKIFRQIEELKINVIIVFAVEWIAENLINTAIKSNVSDKVWIAGYAWSLNERLPKTKGIRNIGTVIGVSEQIIPVPGFSDFIYSLKAQTRCNNSEQKTVCDQICNCSAEEIVAADILIFVCPHQVLAELKKSNFTLLNQSIQFDENGDPMFGSYNIVFWNDSGDVQEIGFYNFPPLSSFFINSTKIQWHTNGTVSRVFSFIQNAVIKNSLFWFSHYCITPILTISSCGAYIWSANFRKIVCIFKIAAKFPKLHSWWIKYHIQWLVIVVAFTAQALVLIIGHSSAPPKPYNDTVWDQKQIILSCDNSLSKNYGPLIVVSVLSWLCFIFSYTGKELPKNYNEAKAITFCLLLLILTWIIFATVYTLYNGKYISILNALAVLSSLYFFLLWYFLPKCYIIVFQPQKNTQQYFQGLIQSYTKTISQ